MGRGLTLQFDLTFPGNDIFWGRAECIAGEKNNVNPRGDGIENEQNLWPE